MADRDEGQMHSVEMDDAYDPSLDNALLQPGSDGLITAHGAGLLEELARRRAAGASLDQLRRDAGQIDGFRVTTSMFERAVDQGRRSLEFEQTGRITEPSKRFAGVTVVTCAACGRRVLLQAVRPSGCAVCVHPTS